MKTKLKKMLLLPFQPPKKLRSLLADSNDEEENTTINKNSKITNLKPLYMYKNGQENIMKDQDPLVWRGKKIHINFLQWQH